MDLAQLDETLNEIRDIQSMIDYSADLEGTKCHIVEGMVEFGSEDRLLINSKKAIK